MPYRTFGIEEVARYLHLSRADIEGLVAGRDIPFERHGGRLVFRKVEIDAWASQRILGLEGRVLRQMAALAAKTGRVCDEQALLEGLEAREELYSTGIPGGLALLHSRNPESYLFETAFVALGRTIQQIPFGAPDGRATDLFFLIGCPDERMHLHTLARLCLMAQETDLLAELREAVDGDAMCQRILGAEQAVLARRGRARGTAERPR
jgi:PTS system nitrogen regulatory IIA component